MKIRSIAGKAATLLAAALLTSPLAAQPVATAAAALGSTVLTFNTVVNGAPAGNQGSVTLSSNLCGNSAYSAAYFGSDVMQVGNFTATGTFPNATVQDCNGSGPAAFSFTFAQAITSFGFFGQARTGIDFFHFSDGNGNIDIQNSSTANSAGWVGFSDANPFTTVTVTVSGGLALFDNLSYKSASVATVTPEPASEALVGFGLLGVFGFIRRRKNG
ncbi:MAG: PEP-CTERM sorting domain-containing protein [Gemmatimonadaceae bacterium]